MKQKALRWVAAGLLCSLFSVVAGANTASEDNDDLINTLGAAGYMFFFWLHGGLRQMNFGSTETSWETTSAAPSVAASGEVKSHNYGYSLEPGEPTLGGKMQKTMWWNYQAPADGRIVLHTFGSDFDTVLAVYTGNSFSTLTLVAANDNRAVAGLEATASLVQFNAVKGQTYRIQLGSRTGTENDMYLKGFRFGAGGGLSAHLALLDGYAHQGRDYFCYLDWGIPCPSPTFLLHNSSSQTLDVTATSSFGPGVTVPAPFKLAPGQAVAKSFKFTAAFDMQTPRTVGGWFTFKGAVAGQMVTYAQTPGLAIRHSAAYPLPAVLKVERLSKAQAGAAAIGLGIGVPLKVTNTGSADAVGCNVHNETLGYSHVHAGWIGFDPATWKAIALYNRPFTVKAGASAYVAAVLASNRARDADPTYQPPLVLDCANTAPAAWDLANSFDISTILRFRPANFAPTAITPVSGVLNVPAAGAIFTVKAKNFGPKVTLTAKPRYKTLNENDTNNQRFTVAGVCPGTLTDAQCRTAATPELNFTAAAASETTVKVFVKPPASNPGYTPGQRRVFLEFKQAHPDFYTGITVGAGSVDVKVQ